MKLALALLLTCFSAPALATPTGPESSTVADCEKLPGTQKAGDRGACINCVTRPKKHHYHPDLQAGERCTPEAGSQ